MAILTAWHNDLIFFLNLCCVDWKQENPFQKVVIKCPSLHTHTHMHTHTYVDTYLCVPIHQTVWESWFGDLLNLKGWSEVSCLCDIASHPQDPLSAVSLLTALQALLPQPVGSITKMLEWPWGISYFPSNFPVGLSVCSSTEGCSSSQEPFPKAMMITRLQVDLLSPVVLEQVLCHPLLFLLTQISSL